MQTSERRAASAAGHGLLVDWQERLRFVSLVLFGLAGLCRFGGTCWRDILWCAADVCLNMFSRFFAGQSTEP